MCRTGGRRCPSHTDPLKVAEYNARRRERYAELKVDTKNQGSSDVIYDHEALKDYFNPGGSSPFNRFSLKLADEASTNNFSVSTLSGAYVNEGYYDEKQVSGVLDPTKITEKTAEELGFSTSDKYRNLTEDSSKLDPFKTLSKPEEEHDPNSVNALNLYSSYVGNWLNAELAKNGSEIATQSTEDSLDLAIKVINYPDWEDEKDIPVELKNSSSLKILTASLDETLSTKALPIQRTMYRGTNRLEETPVHKLGDKVTFDGYASTSYDFGVAAGFAGNTRVIYEIKTPAGLNIMKYSEYDNEYEVMLPRKSHYMVVGQKETLVDNEAMTVVQMIAVDEDNNILGVNHKHTVSNPEKS